MERVASILAGVAMAIAASGAAEARTAKSADAVLASASAEEARRIIDGRLWRCLGTGCRGRAVSAPKSQPIIAECRSVVAAFGPVSLYRSGRELSPAELAECNTAARETPSAGR